MTQLIRRCTTGHQAPIEVWLGPGIELELLLACPIAKTQAQQSAEIQHTDDRVAIPKRRQGFRTAPAIFH